MNRVKTFLRKPTVTLIMAVTRIGGLLAIVKLITVNLYFLHGYLFERELAKINREIPAVL